MALRILLVLLGAAAFLVALNGCMETDHDDLLVWMENERARYKTKVSTPHAPADYHPPSYTLHQGLEPFSRQRLLYAVSVENTMPVTASSPSSIQATPLAAIRLVGSLQKGGQPVALLRVNGLLYSVRVGDRLGQDQGRVSAITLSELVLREVATDLDGQSRERVVSLTLVSEP